MEIDDNKNLEVRTKVLSYALHIEDSVNNLLLANLSITDKIRTKNFGNKSGISFKNKIDLLYDIDILTHEEHNNLELLMNFRNKFMHDINCNSFTYALEFSDNGIVNRFKKFIDPDTKQENEKVFEKACLNLFLHNAKVLLNKYKIRTESLNNKKDFLDGFANSYSTLMSLSCSFSSDVMKIIEESELENPEILTLLQPIIDKCLIFVEEIKTNKDLEFIKNLETLPENLMFQLLK
ncbi:hypothetical protein [Flavobacterium sp. 1355]|uniref:hypothetical protein n=1 Tax=Flavobacterium sp. 1355 TaxID=2806571 RepID=UPI001AEAEFE0|nr:hypothetical protein [Flavobacterium sp. 1355]MBP1222340.1 hypothetical protein [Flavobacterium sp. 1355]